MINTDTKFGRFLQKRTVSLKRNFYTLPFVFICIASCYLLFILFILIKSVGRIDYKPSAVFLFIAIFASILSIVAIIGYTRKEYGQDRPLKMLIIYYVLIAVCIAFTIAVFYFNEKQILTEIAKRDATDKSHAEWYVYQTYINYGICSRWLIIVFFLLEIIANGLLIASPFIEKKLKTTKIEQPLANEKK